MRRYRILLFVAALVVINALALSFTLVDKGSYKNSLYYRFTRQRFAWIISDPKPKYPIQAGWANVTITPTASASGDGLSTPDSIQARALVLDNGTTQAVIISVDLLMMPPTVAQALEQKLPKLGFAWKNVYMGATYSHPGVGGWAKDYMGQRHLGPYNEQQVRQLTEAILKAVTAAHKNKATVQLGYMDVNPIGQEQRLSAGEKAGAESLHLLQLRKVTGESALIISGTVHPILADKTSDLSSQSSFLHLLAQQLGRQTHAFTVALAGPLQSKSGANQVNDPRGLATRISTLLASQPLHTDSTLIAQSTPLIQNDPHIRISQKWRLKPWLAKALYGDYPAELKALRIGQTVFVGCPGGVSVELTKDLLALPVADQRQLVITSYNGGDLGHLVPDKYYYDPNSPYPLGQFNRFGPYTAAFFEDMTQSLVSSLK